MDATVIKKLEVAAAGGDFVVVPKAETDALRTAGAPIAHTVSFSEDDIKVLVELVRVWRGISALGTLAELVKKALYAVGLIIGIVLVIKGKLSVEVLWKALAG